MNEKTKGTEAPELILVNMQMERAELARIVRLKDLIAELGAIQKIYMDQWIEEQEDNYPPQASELGKAIDNLKSAVGFIFDSHADTLSDNFRAQYRALPDPLNARGEALEVAP